jgi:hypothetical protein
MYPRHSFGGTELLIFLTNVYIVLSFVLTNRICIHPICNPDQGVEKKSSGIDQNGPWPIEGLVGRIGTCICCSLKAHPGRPASKMTMLGRAFLSKVLRSAHVDEHVPGFPPGQLGRF